MKTLTRATIPMCPDRGCCGELTKIDGTDQLECMACKQWFEPDESNWGCYVADVAGVVQKIREWAAHRMCGAVINSHDIKRHREWIAELEESP